MYKAEVKFLDKDNIYVILSYDVNNNEVICVNNDRFCENLN